MKISKPKIQLCGCVLLVLALNVAVSGHLNGCPEKIKNDINKVHTISGTNLIAMNFKSSVDGSIQPLLIKLPENYSYYRKWPLLVTLHGLGDGPVVVPDMESMIQIGPYGRGSIWFTGIGKQDVLDCIELAKKIFAVDSDRIYLTGFSMGAAAVLNLGLKYPHKWAACVPVCGKLDRLELIANGENLPFCIIAGGRDNVVPPYFSKSIYKKACRMNFSQWKYIEYENMGHSFDIDWNRVEHWLLTRTRKKNPKKVTFATDNLLSDRAYWVKVTGLKKYGKFARIEAEIEKQTIKLITSNISGYTLILNNRLVDLSKTITIIENGRRVFNGILKHKRCFVKKPAQQSKLRKRPGLSGPLWDIYSRSTVLIYGSNSTKDSLVNAAELCARDFANPQWMPQVDFEIISDASLEGKSLPNKNIVLFGNKNTNRILGKISDELPIKLEKGKIITENAKFSAQNLGYVLLYPNPLNPDKYVAVFAGNSPRNINCFNNIWPKFNSRVKDMDYGIFQINEDNSVNWLVRGIFGTNWKTQ